MAKKCKDCDPNKYIEGLAWRGKNGMSFDGQTIYNDVGKQTKDSIVLADVNDLVEAYNPIFSSGSASAPLAPTSRTVLIEGIDRYNGFWFVWSFINGLVMYGTPGVALSSSKITSAAITTTKYGSAFNFNVTLNKVASYLTYSDFGDLAETSYGDPLVFSSANASTIPFTKKQINYVGYYTGIIKSILNGNKYVQVGGVSQLETFEASKSLTIKSTDQFGNDPIYVNSAPTIHAFKGQSFSYVLTTNLPANKFSVKINSSVLDILVNLGLTWNSSTKTISGTISNNLASEIQAANLTFDISGPNSNAGNKIKFNLSILYGEYDSSITLPTITDKTFNGTVGKSIGNEGLSGLNNKHSIIGISNLPEGLTFNTSSKTITGIPKHGGTFYAYASCSNAKGSSSKVTLTFNFSAYESSNENSNYTYPNNISLPSWNYDVIKNNKINLTLKTDGDEIIKFKKINKSEFETIRKDGEPKEIAFEGKNVPSTSFTPGQGVDAESCFWISLRDPVKENNEFGIKITGDYSIEYSSSGTQDQLGNLCYNPSTGGSGPASTPFTEALSVTVTNTAKTSLSANPAENVPTITISPTQVEHQVVFSPSPPLVPDTYTNGLYGKRYIGYFNDNINWFNTATFQGATNQLTQINGFTSSADSYSWQWFGYFKASSTENYTFYTTSDDASYLWVGDKAVSGFTIGNATVNNGGAHPSRERSSAPISLVAGTYYVIRLQFGEQGDADSVTLSFSTPTIAKRTNGQGYYYSGDPETDPSGILEKTSEIARQRLPKSNLLKYPNGIPAQNGKTYPFYVQFADTCAFNRSYQKFYMYFSTYTSQAGDVYSCSYTAVRVIKAGRYGQFQFYTAYRNETLTSSYIPPNCGTLVSRGSDVKIDNYGYRYGNTLKDTKDIGITSLTNISVLDILGEGPIEGIVDYEIIPNPGYALGDIGYKKGVKLVRYPGNNPQVRSIYWNEIPLADNTYPQAGSFNFEFVRMNYDYADSAPRHANLTELRNIKLEEPFYSRKVNNGQYIDQLVLKDDVTQTILSSEVKLPRRLTSTKVVGTKLFGKREFQDKTSKTYKKSITVLTKDLYGLRISIKILSLFKSIVDLTIWDTADQAAANSVSGRTDRLDMDFYLYLKRIDYTPNKGKEVILIPNPNYVASAEAVIFTISEETYYNNVYLKDHDPLALFWAENGAERTPGHGKGGPDGYLRQPANYSQFINGYTTYSHRHDGKIYGWYAKDVNKLQTDFRVSLQDYINKQQRLLSGEARDYATLTVAGKLNQGQYIETFEWSGLNKYTNSNTIGWEIEVEPAYVESVDINIIAKSSIDSITEIYDDYLSLPNTAGVITTFDSRFFTSIPQRSYDARLLKVKIPSNYNPYSKTYNGVWDGNFNLGWTDNPAWCFYDLITNDRYGLGRYIDPNLTDKWTLYEISQYCDELVSDSKGGLEPRFTANVLISTREDAYKVLNDMASIFRAIIFYSAGLIFTSQDRPKEPLYIFNNSNVKEGEFTYSNTSKRVRRNVALVRYNDKENFYKPAVKYVESREGLIRFGIKEIEVSAFGCTSEGQAARLGKWTLLSENLESELVSFETSLPAMYLKPGDIVYVQDQNRQNKILGGRTYELDTTYAILDIKYEDISGYLPSINGCNFNILTPAGNIEIGTETGNLIFAQSNKNISTDLIGQNGRLSVQSGLNSTVLRRKQVQTIKYETDYTTLNPTDTSVFGLYVTMQDTGSFQGYTRISFAGQSIDNIQHTLIQNTVWTIEINPDNYDHNKSPSVFGLSDKDNKYPGAALEPYIDKTQQFRILDIEELEEHRHKITALQYDLSKFELGDAV